MASSTLMITYWSSLTDSCLIHANHRPNSVFLPRCSLGQQYCLRSTSSGRGCIRSSYKPAMLIDQTGVKKEIIGEIKTEVSRMEKSIGAVPGLAVILVGDTKASENYSLPCLMVGIKSHIVRLAEDCSQEEMLKSISRFNDDPFVHGITIQSPLPSHLDEDKIMNAVSIEKDVDGVNPQNIGRLAIQGREALFVPPAPKACIELIRRHNFEINGKRAVILGRSYTFGMPVALLLQRENATVTTIHSKTKNPEEITREADIVISAVRQPNMVRGSWIKPCAIVINVGSSVVRDRNGNRLLVNDVCYEEVCKVASAITRDDDVIFFMTSLMLLSNVLASAKRCHNIL